MILVSEEKRGVTVTGHADYAKVGFDIVCAGVSALLVTLVESIKALTDSKIEYELKPGNSYVKYKDEDEDTRLLIRSFLRL